jgi:hypothetical protein
MSARPVWHVCATLGKRCVCFSEIHPVWQRSVIVEYEVAEAVSVNAHQNRMRCIDEALWEAIVATTRAFAGGRLW